ncbi:hypothetical protein BT63DRAFT_247405 [Microthyrium microscopicum]|uniref:Uncharacterized protein n=1 Tax=Microthyrium microscopicum TaxID=703497 RepID=A0A6A6UC94_9PEZI|nr:hypothetical protein BT63DRAFT_247405 [Microthyrium microscopicum]
MNSEQQTGEFEAPPPPYDISGARLTAVGPGTWAREMPVPTGTECSKREEMNLQTCPYLSLPRHNPSGGGHAFAFETVLQEEQIQYQKRWFQQLHRAVNDRYIEQMQQQQLMGGRGCDCGLAGCAECSDHEMDPVSAPRSAQEQIEQIATLQEQLCALQERADGLREDEPDFSEEDEDPEISQAYAVADAYDEFFKDEDPYTDVPTSISAGNAAALPSQDYVMNATLTGPSSGQSPALHLQISGIGSGNSSRPIDATAPVVFPHASCMTFMNGRKRKFEWMEGQFHTKSPVKRSKLSDNLKADLDWFRLMDDYLTNLTRDTVGLPVSDPQVDWALQRNYTLWIEHFQMVQRTVENEQFKADTSNNASAAMVLTARDLENIRYAKSRRGSPVHVHAIMPLVCKKKKKRFLKRKKEYLLVGDAERLKQLAGTLEYTTRRRAGKNGLLSARIGRHLG